MTGIAEADSGEPCAPAAKARLSRRRLLAATGGLLALSAAGTSTYAGAIEPQELVIRRYALTPPGWPAGRKLSISVIADLHAGGPDMELSQIRRVVNTANELQSDVIVLLGDFTAHYAFKTAVVPDSQWAAELARLTAPLGTWAILGNHDWWYHLDGVRAALAQVNIPILENQAVRLGAEGHRFWLAGIGDQIAYRLGHGRYRGSTTCRARFR